MSLNHGFILMQMYENRNLGGVSERRLREPNKVNKTNALKFIFHLRH